MPQDYPAIAHLLSTIKTEPVTAEHLQAEDHPYMRTDNDSENAPMLAVNQKLGYRPAPGHYRIVKDLASVEKYA